MQTLNVKSYDDILLYAQTPNLMGDGNIKSMQMCAMLSVFRAQFLFEIFGHRGNIYVL